MRNVNVTPTVDDVVFDPEYFIEGKKYITLRDMTEMILKEYKPHRLMFECLGASKWIFIDQYVNELYFTDHEKTLKETIDKYIHKFTGFLDECITCSINNQNLIYRIGEAINILNDEELLFNKAIIEQEGLIFDTPHGMRVLNGGVKQKNILLKRIGSLDVSVLSYNPKEFVKYIKSVKKVVSTNEYGVILLDVDMDELTRLSPTFKEEYKHKPLLIINNEDKVYMKLPKDTLNMSYVFVRNGANTEIVNITGFKKAIELVVPTNVTIDTRKMFETITEHAPARGHRLTNEEVRIAEMMADKYYEYDEYIKEDDKNESKI